jgi:hypothetical protein
MRGMPVITCDICETPLDYDGFVEVRVRVKGIKVCNAKIANGRAFVPTGLPFEICRGCLPKVLGIFGYEEL